MLRENLVCTDSSSSSRRKAECSWVFAFLALASARAALSGLDSAQWHFWIVDTTDLIDPSLTEDWTGSTRKRHESKNTSKVQFQQGASAEPGCILVLLCLDLTQHNNTQMDPHWSPPRRSDELRSFKLLLYVKINNSQLWLRSRHSKQGHVMFKDLPDKLDNAQWTYTCCKKGSFGIVRERGKC